MNSPTGLTRQGLPNMQQHLAGIRQAATALLSAAPAAGRPGGQQRWDGGARSIGRDRRCAQVRIGAAQCRSARLACGGRGATH